MKRWHLKFRARRVGALGVWNTFYAEREGETLDDAKLALYDEFEHIHWYREAADYELSDRT